MLRNILNTQTRFSNKIKKWKIIRFKTHFFFLLKSVIPYISFLNNVMIIYNTEKSRLSYNKMSEDRKEIRPYEYVANFFGKTGLLVSMDKNEKPNMMACDWKSIGDLWFYPTISVAVAYSRYTYELLSSGAQEFTMNIPSDEISHAIDIAGSYSGRNSDKIKQAGLNLIAGKKTKVPTIAGSILSYECKIIGSSKTEFKSSHHLFFGEIIAAYASNNIIG